MSADDQILLTDILSQAHLASSPTMKLDIYFEVFSAEQILKSRSFDMDPEQIAAGHMADGKGRDGGVDAFYVFVNRKLLRDDTDLSQFKGQQVDIDVVIVQAKNNTKLAEDAIDKFKEFVEQCLKISAVPTKESAELYKERLRNAVSQFHTVFRNSIGQRPTLTIAFYYANMGAQASSGKVHAGLAAKKALLLKKTKEAFSTTTPTLEFLGAKELLTLSQQSPTRTFPLNVVKSLSKGTDAHVCLVELGEFFKLIDDNGNPRGHLFEANVRDYNGEVKVNQGIAGSLAVGDAVDFWWLNNGITIIASDAHAQGDLFSITDPLIVNGLQTSYELHKHFQPLSDRKDKRLILVRIIKTTDETTIDRVIKATNSQTKIPPAWLHATEEIHRRIEVAMKASGLYYDRRKNFYRNQGKAPKSIVTIPYLSQALAAIVMQRPDDARARPTTAAEKNYDAYFPEDAASDIYVKSALALKRVDEFLIGRDLPRGDRLNLSFYVATYAVCAMTKSSKPRPDQIAKLNIAKFDDAFLAKALKVVQTPYEKLGGTDQVSKGPDLLAKLKRKIDTEFRKQKKSAA